MLHMYGRGACVRCVRDYHQVSEIYLFFFFFFFCPLARATGAAAAAVPTQVLHLP